MEQDNSYSQQPQKEKKKINTWWYIAPGLIIITLIVLYFSIIRTTDIFGEDFKCGNGYRCTNPDNGYIYYVVNGEVVDCGFDQSQNIGGLICYDGYKIYDTLGIRLNYFNDEKFGDFYEKMDCSFNACKNESN